MITPIALGISSIILLEWLIDDKVAVQLIIMGTIGGGLLTFMTTDSMFALLLGASFVIYYMIRYMFTLSVSN